MFFKKEYHESIGQQQLERLTYENRELTRRIEDLKNTIADQKPGDNLFRLYDCDLKQYLVFHNYDDDLEIELLTETEYRYLINGSYFDSNNHVFKSWGTFADWASLIPYFQDKLDIGVYKLVENA